MRHHRETFAAIRARPGMWVVDRGFDGAANFVAGYDHACAGGVLLGFIEWLTRRGARGETWRDQILALAFPDAADPRAALNASAEAQRHALDTLFDLIAAFDEVRSRRDGLNEVYTGTSDGLRARRSAPVQPSSREPDYAVDICTLAGQHWRKPEFANWLALGWQLTLAEHLWINFLARIPTRPWTPAQGVRLLDTTNAAEAARVIITSGRILVAPTDGKEWIEELSGHTVWGRQSVFWVSASRYAELDRDLDALLRRPLHLPEPRLHDVPAGTLRTFLERDLPRAAVLDDHDRTLLGLPPRVPG